MEIAAATQTSDATVVRAIQALGFAGLRELKQTMERWFGPSITSSEKMLSTVNALSCDVNSSIDFVLEGHQRACEVLSRPANRAAVAQAVALLSEARQVAIFGIGGIGDSGRVHRQAVQPYRVTVLRAQPYRLQPCRAAD
ncbi:DNA-binding transcriptional repressor RpiR [Raoultella planticola]|uniref:DNA-binding transcriptional repressor RpiR n=1 Tax=Raoultella planticola TaxID=575 RepID=A0A485AIY7_RAOPL|nr:DNA-binding transcriptional repressor RpiR [Raoultella planticola]